jgi:hypothetical protein
MNPVRTKRTITFKDGGSSGTKTAVMMTADPKPNTTCTAEFLHLLLSMQSTIRLMHWMTPSYAHHKALDRLYEAISESGDRLAEFLLAQESTAVFTPTVAPVSAAPQWLTAPFRNSFSIHTQKNIMSMHDELVKMRKSLPDETAQSLMDDIIAAFRGAMYLCKFP